MASVLGWPVFTGSWVVVFGVTLAMTIPPAWLLHRWTWRGRSDARVGVDVSVELRHLICCQRGAGHLNHAQVVAGVGVGPHVAVDGALEGRLRDIAEVEEGLLGVVAETVSNRSAASRSSGAKSRMCQVIDST